MPTEHDADIGSQLRGRKRRRRSVLIGLGVVAVLAIAAVAVVVLTRPKDDPDADARAAAQDYGRRWAAGTLAGGTYDGVAAKDVAERQAAIVQGLDGAPAKVTVTGLERTGQRAEASATVRWTLPGKTWTYRTRIPVAESDGTWKVVWSPLVVHPSLEAGDTLAIRRVQAARASILDGSGAPLVVDRPVVTVGVQPSRATDVDGLSTTLAQLLDVDGPALAARIRAAKPDDFVDVVTLRREDYDPLRSQLQPLPGTVFKEGTRPLAPTRAFARTLLGSVGPATAETVEASEGRIAAGDQVGLSGLQRTYDQQLAGTAGSTVEIVHAKGADGTTPPATALFTVDPVPGTPVGTTLDVATQEAADQALADEPRPSAVVAIRPSTGDILAVAQGPGTSGDIALSGRYPPGSAFKVVSTYALLAQGLDVNANVPCPQFATVDGKQFRNAEEEAFGDTAFHVDFAHSCNTAFVGLSSKLGGTTLPDAAARFGIGQPWKLGVDAFTGSVPEPTTQTEQAAQAFGQGRVLVSPLDLAMVAAAVQAGTWRQPRLLPELGPEPLPDQPLDAGAVDQLRALMREVVTDGTGTAVLSVPGGPVSGKTGTAEFGNDDPPRSHAWFICFHGDLALAVFVEGGEFGGDTAAPIAAKVLGALPAA